MKLSHAVEGFFLDKRLTFSPQSVKKYAHYLNHFIDFTKDPDIAKVTSVDVRRFLAHLVTEHQLSRRTSADAWAVLSSFYTWASGELEIPNVIRGKIAQPTYTRNAIEPYSQDDIKALLKSCGVTGVWKSKQGKQATTSRNSVDRDRAIILTLLDSGCRISELCALTIADYDSNRGRLHIRHGKGDKGRFTVVGSRAQKAIWRYMARRGKTKPTDPLFASRTGGHLDRTNLAHTLQRIGDQAGVDCHAHRFRHTFAVNFLRNGGNVILLRELLGHESMEMVAHYVRVAECDIDSAAQFSPADNWKL